MMKFVLSLLASAAFANGLGSDWKALNDKNVTVIKGGNERCAGGLVRVSSAPGATTLQIGPLIHIEYKKSGETETEPDGSEDCRVERKTTEIAGGLRREISYSKCEEAS
ncbi:MAG TPA: hypothetical protein PL182_11200, partial [Pseudobdellovibrionaceae bacterium]|nr:hypothetical protein [Pseudobdellovibrionaceae bacterium]